MKRTFYSLYILILMFSSSNLFSQNMLVSDAGTSEVNGLYIVAGTYDDVNYYKAGSIYLYRVYGNQWALATVLGTVMLAETYYYAASEASTPAGLTLNFIGYLGTAPGPDVSNSALPVELVFFTATTIEGAVTLNWSTESEVNSVGFIIDRKFSVETTWQQIATYQTNSDLVCMNNQIGNADYSYNDDTVQSNETYSYRLSEVDLQGNVNAVQIIEVTTTDVSKDQNVIISERTELLPAYPNPFNPQTNICYDLAEGAVIDLGVYNVMGQKVRQLLVSVQQPAGSYNLYWNGRDDAGQMATNGVYIVVLKAGDYIKSKKILLMK